MNPLRVFSFGVVLVLLRALFYVTGLDEHACVVSGMLLSRASFVLGPAAVLLALAAPVVAPICFIASACLFALRARDKRARRVRPVLS